MCHDLTFVLFLQLVISFTPAAVLTAGRVGAEGTLAYEGRAGGVKRCRHATLLLSPLLPLQTGGKSAAHRVAQSLPLTQRKEKHLKNLKRSQMC